MPYSILADYSKKAAHWFIESTFPSNAYIAAITGAVAWYSHQVSMTYSQGILSSIFVEVWGTPGYAIAPLFVPSLSPYISVYIRIGVSCATSFTLNMLAAAFFKLKSYRDGRPLQKTPDPVVPEPLINVQPGTRTATQPKRQLRTAPARLRTHVRPRAVVYDDPLISSECLWNLCAC